MTKKRKRTLLDDFMEEGIRYIADHPEALIPILKWLAKVAAVALIALVAIAGVAIWEFCVSN